MNKYQYALHNLNSFYLSDFVNQKESLIANENYKKQLDTLNELVNKEIATEPDVEGDDYYEGEVVYDTWICPRCGARYEIDYDDYEYCPKCGQHIDLDSLEQENDDSDEKSDF